MEDFRYRLIELRQAKELTQGQLAKALNMSRSALSLYELGLRKPDYATLERIADFFNVTTDYLLGRAPLKHVKEVYRSLDGNHAEFVADEKFRYLEPDPDEPTPQEIEDVIRKADLQFDGAPLNDEDKEDIIEFIKVVLRRNKKRQREQRGQATD